MAVYTPLSRDAIAEAVAAFGVGTLVSSAEIAEGVENSNFLIEARNAAEAVVPYILTLYEKRVREADLPYFLGVMEGLAGAGIPCPLPVRGPDGASWRNIAGKPAALVTFLPGKSPRSIEPAHTKALGTALAELHQAGSTLPLRRENTLGLNGWRALYEKTKERLDEIGPGLREVVEHELAFQEAQALSGLPNGIIHADLFPDNVFFEGERLTGLIDFYFSCYDAFAYDLAVCLNSWCFDGSGEFRRDLSAGMFTAYQQKRPLVPEEKNALPVLCRGAALRFLLTRAHDMLFPVAGALVTVKDPLEYAEKLGFHQQVESHKEYGA